MTILADPAPPTPQEAAAAEPLVNLVRLNLSRRLAGTGLVKLRSRFGSLERALSASVQELCSIKGLEPEAAEAIRSTTRADAQHELERAHAMGIQVYGLGHPGYPSQLLQLHAPPLVLYVRGQLELPAAPECGGGDVVERLAAVVGSRRASSYGRTMARRIGQGLARSGVAVVSGLAWGIDAEAHAACLDAGGRTIAVLGCGLSSVYPRRHVRLAERVVHSGALVSELPLDEPALPFHFPRRNRIVAILGEVVCVVQAAARSGSLITAKWALDMGRDVLAVPARVGDPNADGVLGLLKAGAGLVTSAADILEAMGIQTPKDEDALHAARAGAKPPPEGSPEARLLNAFPTEPASVDDLVERSGLDVLAVFGALTRLEVGGAIRRLGGGLYVVA